ncbi:arylsulfatase [Algoriphagus sp. H41]|uniref:Arylsulfatase n=1 Tax=Algoriphagus oliviformis TaxID=2811231 RepID=A0ABS3CA43_9BACT|nr:arylsulfatase [Algoriphagus oliviformis]MBN7812484.1 arylsulfatase [Algoriphagus oliviformis]
MKPVQLFLSLLFSTVFTVAVVHGLFAQQKGSKPNIVVILADDFGVGDIQALYPQNKIPTPHLDRLVREGMSFGDAHSSSAVCTPTRYSFLTGRYNWRTPLQEWVLASYEPPLIREERTTLPEMLRQNGYATACIGKWHLGWNWPGKQASRMMAEGNALRKFQWDYTQPIAGGPIAHGFDYYFGTDVPNFPPFTFIENDRVYIQPSARYKKTAYEGMFLPPIFDDMPMAPDWKFDEILPELTRRAVDYLHERSKEEQPFFLYFSMTSPHEPVAPSERFRGKSGIAPIADFVMETDWSVGQVLKAIEEAGLSDNTLVLFTADNGHNYYADLDKLLKAGHLPSGPYRGFKGDIWEGGHRVPFIVKWKDQVQAGTTSDQLLCLTDVYATVQELVGGGSPRPDEAEDSFSFLPVMLGEQTTSGRTALVSHSNHGEFSFRDGSGWKIVYLLPEKNVGLSRGKPAKVELYNLSEDPEERNDLLERHPDIAAQLERELRAVVERGTSRKGKKQANDVEVRFDVIQKARWALP